MRNGTRFAGLVVALGVLGAGSARAEGTVEMTGDVATVEGELKDGVVEVGQALGFVLRREGLGFVPPGARVRAKGEVLPGARAAGRRMLLRLNTRTLEVLGQAPQGAEPQAPRRGLADHFDGDPVDEERERALEVELERALDRYRVDRSPERRDELLRAVSRVQPETRRRWAARLGEVGLLRAEAAPIGGPIDASSHELRRPEPAAGALPPRTTSGPQLLDAGTWAGKAVNRLFEELQDSLDDLKAAVRARAKALNAKASLSEAEVQEFWDLRQLAAGAGYGAVDAVFTEEGGKAYTAWQASRCAGGRARVYKNYLALGGA